MITFEEELAKEFMRLANACARAGVPERYIPECVRFIQNERKK